jgi:DNA polymerase epsilon subunit 1
MLNHLVHDRFTNHQYQTLVNPDTFEYKTTSENSIFFEVDGPYRAMILPASKEENKLLKKRYAVFDDKGRLVELKGFEVKRRGELKMIKVFQEEVFSKFLEGSTLDECYTSVAQVANRWLDILFTRGATTSDEELLEYISENRSMSKTLEDYGSQKSTSISTAKRLAEFLGDQMVKDKGLACKFIISHKPIGSPVTERAIPVAIFSAELSVKKHFLRKWLRDPSLVNFDIRSILDWQYYIERLGSTIQKLVTIPAAMQQIQNPVPRIAHPDWLLKRGPTSCQSGRQAQITDIFSKTNVKTWATNDMEDIGTGSKFSNLKVISKSKRMKNKRPAEDLTLPESMPDMDEDYSGWVSYQKIKWRLQRKARKEGNHHVAPTLAGSSATSFYQKQQLSLLNRVWEVIQVVEMESAGHFQVWVLIDKQLHSISVNVPRVFYVNCREPDTKGLFSRVNKVLPRSHITHNLYEFCIPEDSFQENSDAYLMFTFHHDTAGVYELHIPLLFRVLLRLGCVTKLDNTADTRKRKGLEDTFAVSDFSVKRLATTSYLVGNRLQYLYLYHSSTDNRHIFGLFYPATGKARVIVVDPYRQTDQLPNIGRLYQERRYELVSDEQESLLFSYSEAIDVTISYTTTEHDACRSIQRALADYQKDRRGPTAILIQSPRLLTTWFQQIRILFEFPTIPVPSRKKVCWKVHISNNLSSHFLLLS